MKRGRVIIEITGNEPTIEQLAGIEAFWKWFIERILSREREAKNRVAENQPAEKIAA